MGTCYFYLIRTCEGVPFYVGRTTRSIDVREREHRRKGTPSGEALKQGGTITLITEVSDLNIPEMDVIEDFFTLMFKTQRKNGGDNVLNATMTRFRAHP